MLTISCYPIGKGLTYKWRLLGTCTLWILFSAVSANGSGVTEDGMRLAGHDVVGPIHVVRTQESDLHQEGIKWVTHEPKFVRISTFDRAETFIETVYLTPSAPEINYRRFTCLVCNQDNRIVQLVECDSERRPINRFRDVYRYDAQGHLVEEFTGSDVDEYRNVYEYDTTGQKTAHRMYDSDGAFIMTIIIRPNREKNLVTVQVGTAAGEFQTKEISAVDSKGRDIETVRFDSHGEILSQTQWSYDDHGKWVERRDTGRDGDIRVFNSYEYDEWGNWTKKTTRKIQPS
jgi:hypothetical protein